MGTLTKDITVADAVGEPVDAASIVLLVRTSSLVYVRPSADTRRSLAEAA